MYVVDVACMFWTNSGLLQIDYGYILLATEYQFIDSH